MLREIPLYNQTDTLENKSIHVYHNKDLDGLSCAFVGNYYEIADYQMGYDYSESFFTIISNTEKFKNCLIIFNDVVPKPHIIKLLDKNNKVVIVDHHLHMIEDYAEVKDELKNTYVFYAPNICASKLLFNLLNDNYSDLDKGLSCDLRFNDLLTRKYGIYVSVSTIEIIDSILTTVDSYDLYKFEKNILDKVKNNEMIPLSEYMPVLYNTFFFSIYDKHKSNDTKSRTAFFNHISELLSYSINLKYDTIVESFFAISPAGKSILDNHEDKINEGLHFHTYDFDDTSYKVALFFGSIPSFYTSLKMKMMVYKQEQQIDFALYVNPSNNKNEFTLSLRSIDDDIDVKHIARKYFNGGGHIKASGGVTTLNNLSTLLNMS